MLAPPVLLTYRLNQDCLENLFSQIRGRGRFRDHPDAQQFRAAFRDVQVDALLTVSRKSNCQEDMDSRLFGLESLAGEQYTSSREEDGVSTSSSDPKEQENQSSACHIEITDHDYGQIVNTTEMSAILEKQEANVLTYIGGYIVRRCVDKVCSSCASLMKAEIDPNESSHQLILMKNYKLEAGQGLTVPSRIVISMVQAAEKAFNEQINGRIQYRGIKTKMMGVLSAACEAEFVDCTCQSKSSMLKLFLNIRFCSRLETIQQRAG